MTLFPLEDEGSVGIQLEITDYDDDFIFDDDDEYEDYDLWDEDFFEDED